MQHEDILIQAETRTLEKDRTGLIRAKLLLQSDLWTIGTRLSDRTEDEGLLATKARRGDAIQKIDVRLQPASSWFGVFAACN